MLSAAHPLLDPCGPCSHGRVANDVAPVPAWIGVSKRQDAYAEVVARARAIGPVANPGVAAYVLAPQAEAEDQEVAWVMLLDVHGLLRGVQEVARGSRDRVSVNFQDMLRAGVIAGAPYVILAHNHPSGSSHPSEADADLTAGAAEACSCLGMLLLDHLVFGLGEVYSFREGVTWRSRS